MAEGLALTKRLPPSQLKKQQCTFGLSQMDPLTCLHRPPHAHGCPSLPSSALAEILSREKHGADFSPLVPVRLLLNPKVGGGQWWFLWSPSGLWRAFLPELFPLWWMSTRDSAQSFCPWPPLLSLRCCWTATFGWPLPRFPEAT